MEKKIDQYLYKNSNEQEMVKYKDIDYNLSNFDDADWTFKSANTTELTHSIFNEYPARMIPQIARRLITLYYPRHRDPNNKKPILDPFAGSGTTNLEALIRNIDSIAFDLNPLSHLITNVRTTIVSYEKLRQYFLKFKKLLEANQNKIFEQYFPDDPNLDYWYNKNVLQKLSVISYAIDVLFNEEKALDQDDIKIIKDIFLLCLAKVGRDCSYQRSGEHKSYRIPKNKIPDFDKKIEPFKHFYDIFKKYAQALGDLNYFYKSHDLSADCKTIMGNSMVLSGINRNSIDLIITSPPYGDSHTTVAYGQFSRFPLEWVQLKYGEIKNIDKDLLGGIKYDFDIIKSELLLNISKNILIEEMQQQNNILDLVIDNIKIQGENDSNLDIIKDSTFTVKNVNDFKIKAKDSSSFRDLIEVKERYFNLIKKIRKNLLDTRNEFKTKDNDLGFLKLKILDERLPFVLSFFSDLYKVLERLFIVLDYDRKCCIVVGNRTVKRVKIPTDEIIVELGKTIGFEYVKTYHREIPNKRMPRKNAPTNVKGEILSTMNEESIIVLNKPNK